MNDQNIFVFTVSLRWDDEAKKVTKKPKILHWQNPENCIPTTREQLNDLECNTGSGYGVLCGGPSGLVVIDFDKAPGTNLKDTFASVPHLSSNTLIVRTVSGGYHVYYSHPKAEIIKSRTNLVPHVDVRAHGGFVVGPGSHCKTPNGASGYEIVSGSWDSIEPLPPKLFTFMGRHGFVKRSQSKPILAKLKADRLLEDVNPDEVREALSHIQLVKGDYGTWFSICCALKHAGLYTEFSSWSAQQPGYKGADDCLRQWQSISRKGDQKITIATVFYLAGKAGWKKQTRKRARESKSPAHIISKGKVK